MGLAPKENNTGDFEEAIIVCTVALQDFTRLLKFAKMEYDNSIEADKSAYWINEIKRYSELQADCNANLEQLKYFRSLFGKK